MPRARIAPGDKGYNRSPDGHQDANPRFGSGRRTRQGGAIMDRAIVFDVNETLLDVGALDPIFVRIFGDANVRREWFGQMLQSAFVSTITGSYRDFGSIGMSALAMVAARHGTMLSDGDLPALGEGMRHLPPHPEVREAMERLRQAGFRLATLT